MFQTTRFSRWFAIALLALASFGAPAVSAQICCFVPNLRQPAPKAQQVYRINGVNYPVDNSGWIWQRTPYGPWVVVGHILATPDGAVALMHAGGRRYRAIRVA